MSLKRHNQEQEEAGAGGLRGLARRLAERASSDPRVQDVTRSVRQRAEETRANLKDRADERLEQLMSARDPKGNVQDVLDGRRQQRDVRAGQIRARKTLLAQAQTPHEKRVLQRIVDTTPWAGGQAAAQRYTGLLDALAPGGEAEEEMAVHRAIWSLAERHVLSVSPHGEVRAMPGLLSPSALSAGKRQNERDHDHENH